MNKIFYSFINSENIDVIIEGLNNKKEYNCIIPYFDQDSELLISRIILKFLQDSPYDINHQNIAIIVNEIITNVNKANICRDFYINKNLDLKELTQDRFSEDQLTLDEYYNSYMSNLSKQDKQYYINITIKITDSSLIVSVINGFEVLDWELEKIKGSIEFANRYNSLKEIFNDNPNVSDIEHFSYILSVLMLKNINLKSDAITITRHNGITEIDLIIPLIEITDIHAESITEEIINEISELPQFPDSVLRLQKELLDPEWDYDRISNFILSDSSLTAEILRLVNSPVYRIQDKIDKVTIAVKKIGIMGLKAILYNFGSMEILRSKYDLNIINHFKEHQFKVALIASYLANYKNYNEFSEDIYVAAIMHDIGKIITNSLQPEFFNRLNNYCNEKVIPSDIIEKLSDGYNHALIGAKLSQKWNFPEKYTNAIRHHHTPLEAPSEFKIITFCVYLADQIIHYNSSHRKYGSINPLVLIYFNLESESKFRNLIKQMEHEGIFLY